MSLDHVNNDGAAQRVSLHKLYRGDNHFYLYRAILAGNAPTDIQTLCFNCNFGKGINNGICPHRDRLPLVDEQTIPGLA